MHENKGTDRHERVHSHAHTLFFVLLSNLETLVVDVAFRAYHQDTCSQIFFCWFKIIALFIVSRISLGMNLLPPRFLKCVIKHMTNFERNFVLI